MEEEDQADQAHRDGELDDLVLQRRDGANDEIGAVVRGDNLHAFGERRLDVALDAFLHALDDVEHIFTETHHHDAARNLASSVEVGDAAPYLGPELDAGHIAQVDGCAAAFAQGHVVRS